jgi:hypothetical protein
MAKAACVELRVREGVEREFAYLKMQSILQGEKYRVIVQQDEINIDIEYTTDEELLNVGMLYGKLMLEIERLCFVHFTAIGRN